MINTFSVEEASLFVSDGVELFIGVEKEKADNTLLKIPEDIALEHGEELVQLLESCGYEYELPEHCRLEKLSGVVHPSRRHPNRGRLTPGIYVGRLELAVFNSITEETYPAPLEVRSIKADYRTEYQLMLEDIAKECTELLMLHSSPTTQHYTVDHNTSPKTLYQRFMFVKSIADSDDFRNAVHRIISMPVTAWEHSVEERDIRRCRRITASQIRQMASRNDRMKLSAGHPLQKHFSSIPSRLETTVKYDTVDTPENRFVKQALKEFERFCGEVCQVVEEKYPEQKNFPHIHSEAKDLEERFAGYLSHTVFREVGHPVSLPLNSPVLQRKEGYREVLRVWLVYDLAGKLIWNGLDEETYNAGKRDVATLYEYWLFFKLLRLIETIFKLPPKATSELVKPTGDGLCLQLKAGSPTAVKGEFEYKGRELTVQFFYNRTFNYSDYPKSGSWTQQMRPDYTLSIWPAVFSDKEAEEQEAIVHVHFDAKYKVAGLEYLEKEDRNKDSEQKLNQEKVQQKEGIYKRADLLKMHAYKDAIRRTAGAYVLYPGSKKYEKKGFHEIVPGLGAFPVSPSNDGGGLVDVESFIMHVLDHFSDRTSHRESISYETYRIHKKRKEGALHDALPEKYGDFRAAPPQSVAVLVGYYQQKQKSWIEEKGLYNIPITKTGGLEKYGPAETGASYILLRGKGEMETGQLWKVISKTPQLKTKEDLIADGYDSPSKEHYLVYAIEKSNIHEFNAIKWDVRKLRDTSGYGYAVPFSVSLEQLMNAKVKD